MPQTDFLHSLGISVRVASLCAKHPEKREEIEFQYQRLTSPSEMGDRFKFVCITNSSRLPFPF